MPLAAATVPFAPSCPWGGGRFTSSELKGLPATNFQQRHEAILEGEKAGFAAIARVRETIAAWQRKNG